MAPNTPTIRLRHGTSSRLREIFRARTDTEVAERLGVDQGFYSRAHRGVCGLGPYFMARLILAVTAEGIAMADFFEIHNVDGEVLPIASVCTGPSVWREISAGRRSA